MLEKLLTMLIEKVSATKMGVVFAVVFFVIALLLCIFGFYKTLFIIIFTIVGFFVGSFLFNDKSRFKELLDRILPPGRVR